MSSSSSTPAEDKKRLLHAIINYLQNDTSVDQESVSVATEVIKSTYNVDMNDSSLHLPTNVDLQSVFSAGVEKLNVTFAQNIENDPKFKAFIAQLEKLNYFKETANETRQQKMEKAKQKFLSSKPTESPQILADRAKEEGNQFMKAKKYNEAIEAYKKAIGHDPRNPIYPSNMAAAYLNLGDTDKGLKCCLKAIELDETFHKGYFRLGTIYDRLGKLEEALEQYELALKHSPGNKEYSTKVSQLKRELDARNNVQTTPFGGAGGGNPFASMFGGGGGGMPDLGSLLGGMGGAGGGMPNIGQLMQDPNFMNMAMNMMQQPGVQEMMQGMMQGMGMNAGMGGDTDAMENHRAAMDKILQDPEVMENPRLKSVFEEAREGGPQALLQYTTDPDVSQFLMKYAQQNINMDQLQGLFGGGPPRQQDDDNDDNNSNMYS